MAPASKLKPRDLCLIHGEADPRLSSIRVADALHESGRAQFVHRFIERNREELEDYGSITRHGLSRAQGGGREAFEYLLNEAQVFIICMRSDSKWARQARRQTWELISAYRRGEIPHSEITIIADLFTPQRPMIEYGADNVVHIKHEQARLDLDDTPSDRSRIRDNPTFVEPSINDAFLNTIADMGHTPRGYGDGSAEQPTMFMRDELPLGHHADSWRVWVSEQWFRLPLELRQRWWRDTDYGKRAPSAELIEAIIAISLP